MTTYCEIGNHWVDYHDIFGEDEDGDDICVSCVQKYFGAEQRLPGDLEDIIMDEYLEDGEDYDDAQQYARNAVKKMKAETILLKDSCCCGATIESPCACMKMGVMNCSATCPCSDNPKHQGTWEIQNAEEFMAPIEIRQMPQLSPRDEDLAKQIAALYQEMAQLFDAGELTKEMEKEFDEDIEHLFNLMSPEGQNPYGAESFEAPYVGSGALMDIGKDTALSSFSPSELATSSAIHGDFDTASLDYSGHQNLEVRAEVEGNSDDWTTNIGHEQRKVRNPDYEVSTSWGGSQGFDYTCTCGMTCEICNFGKGLCGKDGMMYSPSEDVVACASCRKSFDAESRMPQPDSGTWTPNPYKHGLSGYGRGPPVGTDKPSEPISPKNQSPSATIPSWVVPVSSIAGFVLGFLGMRELKKVL